MYGFTVVCMAPVRASRSRVDCGLLVAGGGLYFCGADRRPNNFSQTISEG